MAMKVDHMFNRASLGKATQHSRYLESVRLPYRQGDGAGEGSILLAARSDRNLESEVVIRRYKRAKWEADKIVVKLDQLWLLPEYQSDLTSEVIRASLSC